jgi:hypothetical protein
LICKEFITRKQKQLDELSSSCLNMQSRRDSNLRYVGKLSVTGIERAHSVSRRYKHMKGLGTLRASSAPTIKSMSSQR